MTGKEYQKLAMRTNDKNNTIRLLRCAVNSENFGDVLNACIGLSGEVGEFNDLIKKWIFHEKEFDEMHLKKELGDIMWYIADVCYAFKWNLDEIMQMNVEKLKERYPEGFDVKIANNRKNGDV